MCALPVSVLHGVGSTGVAPERLASLRAQRHARAAKVVTDYDRSVWADARRKRTLRGRAASRLDVAAARWRPFGTRSARARHVASRHGGGASALHRVQPRSTGWASLRGARAHVRRGRRAGRSKRSSDSGRPTRSRSGTRRIGGRATCSASVRCTARTTRRSTSAGPTSGSPGYMEGAVRTGRAAAAAALRSEAWTPA